jgi:predicted dehydrogenase
LNPVISPGGNPLDVIKKVHLGFIGLDRSGQFHAERLSLRSEFKIVAACDPTGGGARRLPGPRGLDRPVDSHLDALLARDEIDTVLIAGPIERRAEWALSALEAKRHVVLDPPPCTNAAQMRELISAAHRAARRLSVLPARRAGAAAGPDFRAALQIARDNRLGPIYSARLVSWGKAVPRQAGGSTSSGAADCEADVFLFFTYQYVDQLLQLIRQPPRSVFARILPRSGNHQPSDDRAATAFVLVIAFGPGVDAMIDVNLDSGAPLQTGWILAGARGGYSGGRVYEHDASGEICDAPVSQTDLPETDLYSELIGSVNESQPGASAAEAEVVMRVIDAARESSRTGQSVAIGPETA